MTDDHAANGAPAGIDDLCRHATSLIEAAQGPLRSVRVQAGDLMVEVEWSAPHEGAQAATLAPVERVVVPDGAVVTADDGSFVVHAPLVGTFYRSPSPGAPPFVDVGYQVVAGQQVGIVEAMKLMNPVEVDRPGRVVEVLVTDGAAVEYGEALFVVAPV